MDGIAGQALKANTWRTTISLKINIVQEDLLQIPQFTLIRATTLGSIKYKMTNAPDTNGTMGAIHQRT
jgi:hypothetical protein